MKTEKQFYIIFVIIGAILVTGTIILDQRDYKARIVILERIHTDLKMEFVKGYVDSPSVKIPCDTFSIFKQKVFELNAITVYFDGNEQVMTSTYYVFNKEMTIAWYYNVRYNPINAIWVNP